MNELPVIQKTYDFIKWFVPILNRLPRDHKFGIGDRIISHLYDLLEGLIMARYTKDKVALLEILNAKVDILRHQSRLLLELNLIELKRYEFIGQHIHEIGSEVGGWLKHQKKQKVTV